MSIIFCTSLADRGKYDFGVSKPVVRRPPTLLTPNTSHSNARDDLHDYFGDCLRNRSVQFLRDVEAVDVLDLIPREHLIWD
jgi:hypothetical protein